MNIAICQTNMKWTVEENLEQIKVFMQNAVTQKADLAIFPECAVTGYHRKLPQNCQPQLLQSAFDNVSEMATQLKLDVIVGSPYIFPETPDQRCNSALYFNAQNAEIQIASKIGLTDGERQFFTPGKKRGIFTIQNKRVGVIFCREIIDREELLTDFRDEQIDFIIWPSYIKWDADPDYPEYVSEEMWIGLSRELGIPVVNANWANALNGSDITGMGGSVLAELGETAFRCQVDKEMLHITSV